MLNQTVNAPESFQYDNKTYTRKQKLGKGGFGEVHQYQGEDGKLHIVKFILEPEKYTFNPIIQKVYPDWISDDITVDNKKVKVEIGPYLGLDLAKSMFGLSNLSLIDVCGVIRDFLADLSNLHNFTVDRGIKENKEKKIKAEPLTISPPIIHGDMKSQNVALNPGVDIAEVKKVAKGISIIDLDMAQKHPYDDKISVSVEGSGGTDYYLPPELVWEDKKGLFTDIYAITDIIAELLRATNPLKDKRNKSKEFSKDSEGRPTFEELKAVSQTPFNLDGLLEGLMPVSAIDHEDSIKKMITKLLDLMQGPVLTRPTANLLQQFFVDLEQALRLLEKQPTEKEEIKKRLDRCNTIANNAYFPVGHLGYFIPLETVDKKTTVILGELKGNILELFKKRNELNATEIEEKVLIQYAELYAKALISYDNLISSRENHSILETFTGNKEEQFQEELFNLLIQNKEIFADLIRFSPELERPITNFIEDLSSGFSKPENKKEDKITLLENLKDGLFCSFKKSIETLTATLESWHSANQNEYKKFIEFLVSDKKTKNSLLKSPTIELVSSAITTFLDKNKLSESSADIEKVLQMFVGKNSSLKFDPLNAYKSQLFVVAENPINPMSLTKNEPKKRKKEEVLPVTKNMAEKYNLPFGESSNNTNASKDEIPPQPENLQPSSESSSTEQNKREKNPNLQEPFNRQNERRIQKANSKKIEDNKSKDFVIEIKLDSTTYEGKSPEYQEVVKKYKQPKSQVTKNPPRNILQSAVKIDSSEILKDSIQQQDSDKKDNKLTLGQRFVNWIKPKPKKEDVNSPSKTLAGSQTTITPKKTKLSEKTQPTNENKTVKLTPEEFEKELFEFGTELYKDLINEKLNPVTVTQSSIQDWVFFTTDKNNVLNEFSKYSTNKLELTKLINKCENDEEKLLRIKAECLKQHFFYYGSLFLNNEEALKNKEVLMNLSYLQNETYSQLAEISSKDSVLPVTKIELLKTQEVPSKQEEEKIIKEINVLQKQLWEKDTPKDRYSIYLNLSNKWAELRSIYQKWLTAEVTPEKIEKTKLHSLQREAEAKAEDAKKLAETFSQSSSAFFNSNNLGNSAESQFVNNLLNSLQVSVLIKDACVFLQKKHINDFREFLQDKPDVVKTLADRLQAHWPELEKMTQVGEWLRGLRNNNSKLAPLAEHYLGPIQQMMDIYNAVIDKFNQTTHVKMPLLELSKSEKAMSTAERTVLLAELDKFIPKFKEEDSHYQAQEPNNLMRYLEAQF